MIYSNCVKNPGKLLKITKKCLQKPWGGFRDGRTCRCYLCGIFFAPGDFASWIYCNSTPGMAGNVSVCENCYIPDQDLMRKCIKKHKKYIEKIAWSLISPENLPKNPYT